MKKKIPQNKTVFIKDNATQEDFDRIMKYMDDLEKGNSPFERVPVASWAATDEQRKAVLDKIKELHGMCKEANIPMLFIGQIAQEEDGPIIDQCMVGATARSSRFLDIIKAVWMLMFDGGDRLQQFNAQELRAFCDQIQTIVLKRIKQ